MVKKGAAHCYGIWEGPFMWICFHFQVEEFGREIYKLQKTFTAKLKQTKKERDIGGQVGLGTRNVLGIHCLGCTTGPQRCG